jgi:uncharacterized protein YukE
MAQAVADPAELRRFAGTLRRFVQEMTQQTTAMRSQMQGLGQTWRDQEYQKFVDEYEQALVIFTRMLENAEQYVPFLTRKADRLEEYLQQR